MLVKVTVNASTCIANQMCMGIAGDIFELDPAGYSRVKRDVTEADLAALREAEEMCPSASITIDVLEAD
jgi:ferredoxin